MEPEGPQHRKYHRKILEKTRIPNTRAGWNVVLECNHRIQIYGDHKQVGPTVFCQACKNLIEHGTK
jgi:hypothetical protein